MVPRVGRPHNSSISFLLAICLAAFLLHNAIPSSTAFSIDRVVARYAPKITTISPPIVSVPRPSHHRPFHYVNMAAAENEHSKSQLTDWVVENLETPEETITTYSTVQAGENDTLPVKGLCIDKVRILAADAPYDTADDASLHPIRLLLGRNGWGTGVHPTTRLCLEWLCREDVLQGGEVLLDYGCGSGVLSIAALHMGASRAIGVDVEAEALVTAERNLQLNGYGAERFEGFHTREVIPYGLCRPSGVDVCVANILVGQLVRPSMVAAILSNLALGGKLCLSGIRPHEVDALRQAYGDSVAWCEDQYGELSCSDCEGSMASYCMDLIAGDGRDS